MIIIIMIIHLCIQYIIFFWYLNHGSVKTNMIHQNITKILQRFKHN